MLHKSKSKNMHAYKYALVLPLLVLFVFQFNTEIIAQTATPEPESVQIGQNILKYVISKDTKDTQLESIKAKMAEQEVTLAYKDLERNDRKEIIGIRIEYDSKKGSGQFFVNSEEPIADIAISLNVNDNKLSVGPAIKNLSQSFEIIKEDGEKKLKTSGTDNNVFVYSTDNDDDKTVTVVGKDGDEHIVTAEKNVYVFKSASVKNSSEADDIVFVKKNKKDTVWIKQDVKNIVWINDDGEDVEIIAAEKSDKNTKIFNSGYNKPLILMDGKEISNSELSNIKTDKILSVDVLKGNDAIKNYGSKGKDGVIFIKTKDDASLNGANQTIAVGGQTISTKKDANSIDKSNPWAIKTEITMTSDEDDVTSLKSYSTSVITKNTIDKSLEAHKQYLKSEGVTFNYSKLKRNKDGLIVRIKVELSNGNGKSKTATFTNDDGISQISMGIKDGNLFLNSSDN